MESFPVFPEFPTPLPSAVLAEPVQTERRDRRSLRVDLDNLADVRKRLGELPYEFLDVAERKADIRRTKIRQATRNDEQKKESKRVVQRALLRVKAADPKLKVDEANALAAHDPESLKAEQDLALTHEQLDLLDVEYELLGDTLTALKMMHRSMSSLLGDMNTEMRVS
jgi:hypothetical protein